MKRILIIFIVFIVSSCDGGSGTVTLTSLINNSGYDVEIQTFLLGQFDRVLTIKDKDQLELSISMGDGNGNSPFLPPPFGADSTWVIYYEKASIWHTTDVNSPVSKSLMLESSYEGGKVRDGLYEFTYTFTPEDFEEALEFGD